MKEKKLISQSFIKDVEGYQAKTVCGNLLRYKHVEGNLIPGSDVMAQGNYFEYIATGALPKSGEKPEPVMLDKPKRKWTEEELKDYLTLNKMPNSRLKTPPLGVPTFEEWQTGVGPRVFSILLKNHEEEVFFQSMTTDYRRAYTQAQNFKKLCRDMGIEILKVQEYRAKGELEGVRDLQIRWQKKKYTVDLKYSGLIHNSFEPFGWGALVDVFRDEKPESKGFRNQIDNHKTQALQYEYVFMNPFIYWVFSSAAGAEDTGENIMLAINSEDQFEQQQHELRALKARSDFEFIQDVGFTPYPEYNKCQACEIRNKCKDRAKVPEPIKVTISTNDD